MSEATAIIKTLAKLRSFANTPEKKKLLERTTPSIEALLNPQTYGGDLAKEGPKNLWLHGSFKYKDNPKDIDLAAKFPYLWGEGKALKARPKENSYDPYFFTKHDLKEGLPDRQMMKEAVVEGKKRYGKDYKWTKILGLTAMLTAAGATPDEITGVTDMFKTKEANAMPLGKLLKAGTKEALKAAEGLPSSTAKVLKGKSLEGTAIQGMKLDSKVVADVRSGIGNWRNIIFEDGSSLPVTTDFLESIMREHGKATYAAKRAVMTAEEQLKEAEASLQYHLNRTYTEGKNRPVKFQEKHSQRMNELVGPERGAEMIGFWHGRRYVIMPKYQAEILERNGKGRIDRSKIGVIPQ
jgi:hypothetical protein